MKRVTGILLLIALVLAGATHAPAQEADEAAAAEAARAEGARIYLERCAACHGESGRGDGPMAKMYPVPPTNFSDASFMETRTDEGMREIISLGGGPIGRAPFMPGFGIALSEGEIDLVIGHIKTLAK